MIIYYGGAEIPTHRSMLKQEGVTNQALSFMGLLRRTKLTKPWLVSEKFDSSINVFLDSGAYTVNRDETKFTQGELKDLYIKYQKFVMDNIDALTLVSEFDALPLGVDWIKSQREDFWSDVPEDKLMVIWHPNLGISELDHLCSTYKRVGIPKTALGDRNLAPILNGYVQSHKVKLHGVAMTKPDEMREIKWDSVASTSWISPAQFGDTIVWTGRELKRYPKAYKEEARKRHRTLFTEHGFNAEAIAADDSKELLRLSIWSWRKVEESINSRGVVATPEVDANTVFGENTSTEVDTLPQNSGNRIPTRIRDESERKLLPIMGIDMQKEKYTDDAGKEQEREIPLITSRSASLRVCDTCFLANKCPAFEPGANCAYDIPVQVRTRDQFRALFNGIVEMQSQRVLFAKMAEDMEGGYPDPNLSKEIKLLTSLMDKKHEMEQEAFSLTISGRGNSPGAIMSLFGKDAADRANALPAAVNGDDAVAEIIDVEVLPDIESSN